MLPQSINNILNSTQSFASVLQQSEHSVQTALSITGIALVIFSTGVMAYHFWKDTHRVPTRQSAPAPAVVPVLDFPVSHFSRKLKSFRPLRTQ